MLAIFQGVLNIISCSLNNKTGLQKWSHTASIWQNWYLNPSFSDAKAYKYASSWVMAPLHCFSAWSYFEDKSVCSISFFQCLCMNWAETRPLSVCLHRACGTLWAELGSPTPVWGLPLWAMTWACGWIALSWVVMHAYSGGIMWTQLSALCLKWLLLLYSIIHIWVLKSTQLYQTHTNKSEMWVLGSIF